MWRIQKGISDKNANSIVQVRIFSLILQQYSHVMNY